MMSVLGQLQPGIAATQGKMHNHGAFFFIASPNSITPVHIDIDSACCCSSGVPRRSASGVGRVTRSDGVS